MSPLFEESSVEPAEANTSTDLPALEAALAAPKPAGEPLLVALTALFEDPANPRTEFSDEEIDELAADIRQRGILQPIVVHPADAAGRWCIHFGAKRFRAAGRAKLVHVPVSCPDAVVELLQGDKLITRDVVAGLRRPAPRGVLGAVRACPR